MLGISNELSARIAELIEGYSACESATPELRNLATLSRVEAEIFSRGVNTVMYETGRESDFDSMSQLDLELGLMEQRPRSIMAR